MRISRPQGSHIAAPKRKAGRAQVGASRQLLVLKWALGASIRTVKAMTSLGFTSAKNKNGSNSGCSTHMRQVLEYCLRKGKSLGNREKEQKAHKVSSMGT
jgi:hypothetical protein